MSAEGPQLIPGTVQAVRAWDLVPEVGTDRMLLGAIAQCEIWPQGTAVAECRRREHVGKGPPPGPGCDCGIYAYHRHGVDHDFISSHTELDQVVGVIDTWGRIEVHESGVRAQHARIASLLVDSGAPPAYLTYAARAAATYGVELVRLSAGQFDDYLREQVRGLDEAFIERLLLADCRLVLEPRSLAYISRRGEAIGGFGFVDVDDPTAPKRFQKRLQIGSLTGDVIRVAGARYHGHALQGEAFAPGHELVLLPEPDNPRDSDAVSVWDAGGTHKVGYVPRSLAGEIGSRLAAGRIAAARSVWQWRDLRTGRRTGLHMLLASTPEVEFIDGEQLVIDEA